MRVRYNRGWAVGLLVLGILATLLNLWTFLLGVGSVITLITALIPILLGALMLGSTYFVVGNYRLTRYAMIGSFTRDFPYQRLEFVGSGIVLTGPDGARKKAGVTRWMARREDWDALTAQFRPAPG